MKEGKNQERQLPGPESREASDRLSFDRGTVTLLHSPLLSSAQSHTDFCINRSPSLSHFLFCHVKAAFLLRNQDSLHIVAVFTIRQWCAHPLQEHHPPRARKKRGCKSAPTIISSGSIYARNMRLLSHFVRLSQMDEASHLSQPTPLSPQQRTAPSFS